MNRGYIVLMVLLGITAACVMNPSESEPAPKAYEIAFISNRDGNNQVYLMDMEGQNQQRLTHDSQDYHYPQFSPDGSKILFCVQQEGNDEILIMDADGRNQVNLTNSPGNDNLPQFSPDGSLIVFTSDRDGQREIYLMNVDGTEQQRLTDNEYTDHSPIFFPDGNRIAFYSLITEDQPDYHIYTYDIFSMGIDGGNLTRLTPEAAYLNWPAMHGYNGPSVSDARPAITPDGRQIAFISYGYDHGYDIYIMNSDGSNPHRLTTSGSDFAPCFTPEGESIVFKTHRGGVFDIYSMNVKGENLINLTPETMGHASLMQISPDGASIVYEEDTDVYIKKRKIFVMERDGKNTVQLTTGDYDDLYPRFRP